MLQVPHADRHDQKSRGNADLPAHRRTTSNYQGSGRRSRMELTAVDSCASTSTLLVHLECICGVAAHSHLAYKWMILCKWQLLRRLRDVTRPVPVRPFVSSGLAWSIVEGRRPASFGPSSVAKRNLLLFPRVVQIPVIKEQPILVYDFMIPEKICLSSCYDFLAR